MSLMQKIVLLHKIPTMQLIFHDTIIYKSWCMNLLCFSNMQYGVSVSMKNALRRHHGIVSYNMALYDLMKQITPDHISPSCHEAKMDHEILVLSQCT